MGKIPNSVELEAAEESIASNLKEFGLSSYAAKSFVSILQNQPVSATSLCKLTGIPDSKIYYAIRELEERNLIMTQRGTPSLYRAMSITQITSSLLSQLEGEYKRRTRRANELARSLEPLYSSSGNQEVELAYIIKGSRNIIERMKETIDEAKKEMVVMFTDVAFLTGIVEALKRARSRGVLVKLAVPENALESDLKNRIRPDKTLLCQTNILIADSQKLIAVSGDSPSDSRAVVTQDESMIHMGTQNYENPSCCVDSRRVLTDSSAGS